MSGDFNPEIKPDSDDPDSYKPDFDQPDLDKPDLASVCGGGVIYLFYLSIYPQRVAWLPESVKLTNYRTLQGN
jgi:hypothetical protein